MSYYIQSQMARDSHLIERAGACAATLGVPGGMQWAARNALDLVVTPGWVEAYEAAGGLPDGDPADYALVIGARPDVITDAMILEAVRRLAGIAEPGPMNFGPGDDTTIDPKLLLETNGTLIL